MKEKRRKMKATLQSSLRRNENQRKTDENSATIWPHEGRRKPENSQKNVSERVGTKAGWQRKASVTEN